MNGERWTFDGLLADRPPADTEFVLASDYDGLAAALRNIATNNFRTLVSIDYSDQRLSDIQTGLSIAASMALKALAAYA